ncbi:MAG TPA: hypothetical protein VM285_00315 [Polyangia bacterium]|nr:hypothetical protein [Polyangia bacterium]
MIENNVTLVLGLVWCIVASTACGPRQDGTQVPLPDPVTATSSVCHAPTIGPNVRITNAVEDSLGPLIAWNGASFDIAWRDLRGRHSSVYVARVDRAGSIVAEEARIPGEAAARDQTLAVDTTEGQLAFLEQGSVRSVRLRDEPLEPLKIDEDVTFAAAGPAGAVAWVRKGNLLLRSDARLLPPDRDGKREEPPPALLGSGGIFDVALAWNGKLFAVAWSESAGGSKRVMLQRATVLGEKIGPALQVSAAGGVNRQPVVVWSGEDWFVVWTNEVRVAGKDEPRYRVFFALVPAEAGAPRATAELGLFVASERVALAATGREFGVAWVENLDPMGSVVFFQRLSREGKLLGIPLKVSDEAPLNCGRPDLSWAGDGFGVTWHDDREPAGSEVYFSFVTCGQEPPPPPAKAADAGPPAPDAGVEVEEGEDRPLPELYTEEGEKKSG